MAQIIIFVTQVTVKHRVKMKLRGKQVLKTPSQKTLSFLSQFSL